MMIHPLHIPAGALIRASKPVYIWWSVSVSLRLLAALATRWRMLRWYLTASAAGSVVLMLTPDKLYEELWTAKGFLLLIGNLILMRSAVGRRLSVTGYGACAAATVVAASALVTAPRWPDAWLEASFTGFGLCSLFLGLCIVLGWRSWNDRVLGGYLLLDALALLSASAHIETVGVAISLACCFCYLGWIGVGVEERTIRRSS